jgi:MFS family permease
LFYLERFIGSFLAIGAFAGALPAGILAEKVGRKFAIISIAIPYIISWISLATASNITMIFLGRFFGGLATGASCVGK